MIPILDTEPLCFYEVRSSYFIEDGRIKVTEVAPFMLSIRHNAFRSQKLSLREVKGIFVKFYRGDKE